MVVTTKSVASTPVTFSLKVTLKVTEGPVVISVNGNCRLMLETCGAVLSNVTWLPLVVVVTWAPATPLVLVKLIVNGTTPVASVLSIVLDAV